MRGNPWIRIILVALGVILAGWPVWRLTHADVPVETGISTEALTAEALTVTVTFAHAPESFSVSNVGKPILSGAGPATEFHGSWPVNLPKEGADLLIKAQWPAGTPRTAVEIRVETANRTVADQSFWGNGQLTEILTVLPPQP